MKHRSPQKIVGIRFSPTDAVRYFDPRELDLSIGDRVLVECRDGAREGTVVMIPEQVTYSELSRPLEYILGRIGGEKG